MPDQDFFSSVGFHLVGMIKQIKKVNCQLHQILGEARTHERKSLHHTIASLLLKLQFQHGEIADNRPYIVIFG